MWAPTPQLPPGDSSPPPIHWLFSLDSFVSPPFSCPRLRGRRGQQEGVSGGCLSFMAFQNPRLSLAHLSFSFTIFSALGSGYISRKFSSGVVGRALPGLGLGRPGRTTAQPWPHLGLPLLLHCGGTHHLGFQLRRSWGN